MRNPARLSPSGRWNTLDALKICLCVAACAFAQKSSVPYATNGDSTGPTFAVQTESSIFPGSYRSIRSVDFRNLNNGRVSLRNGHYERNEDFDHYAVDLDSLVYFSSSAALVVYSWSEVAVSSESGAYAVVFTLSNGRLHSVQSINWETHSAGPRPTWSFEPKSSTFVVRSDHYMPGDAHCCISAVDVVTFHWDGKQFTQTGIKTELSDYGKGQGRTLP